MIKTENKNFHEAHPLMILPAAGFGTRSGSSASKELQPGSDGEPLISFHLRQALARGWPVHLITRTEKKDLLEYIQAFQLKTNLALSLQIIEPSREWPDTLLQSQEFWRERNILCLPDTVYEPLGVLDQMQKQINEADLSVACFSPQDSLSQWGYVRENSEVIELCEKPQETLPENTKAWGLLGFKRSLGKALFEAQLQSTFDHKWKQIRGHVLFLSLSEFIDSTRKINAPKI